MALFFNFHKWRFPCLKSKENCSAGMPTVAKPNNDPSGTLMARGSASCGNTCLAVAKGEYTFSWGKKYRPKDLKDFICHKEKAESIQSMKNSIEAAIQAVRTVCSGLYNHCIFEGPPGVGKRTMALAMLRECAGLDITETREEFRELNLGGSKGDPSSKIPVKIKVSSQLIQIDLSELRWRATDVVLELLEETYINGKAIIVNEAERLSKDAQLRIKSFLEIYRGHYKVIFCCYDISRLQHLGSLFMVIPLLPPSNEEIVEVLNFIAKQQDIELPDQLANNIAEKSNHCLQQAIRSFEATWHSKYPFKEDQLVMTGWEEEIANIAKSIIEEQSSKRLFLFRQKLQILLQHNLCPQFVFVTLVEELKRHLDDRIQMQIGVLWQTYSNDDNEDLRIGRKKFRNQDEFFCEQKIRTRVARFVRIEEFVAKFMSFYKYNGTTKAER